MSSDKGKKFSLDEMTDMYKPNEEETQNEIPMVLLTEEEWNSLIATLGQMQALTDEMEMQNRRFFSRTETALRQVEKSVSGLNTEMRGHIRNLQEQTDKAFRQTQAEYAKQVGKLNEEYTSLVRRTDKREKVMFWTSLISSLFPLALVFFWLALQG
jgi:hypothetical protein